MLNRIKEVRKLHGDTLKSLAQKINYDYSNLSKIERGVYDPSISILKKIANIYGVSVQYLIGYEREEREEREEHMETQFICDLERYAEESLNRYIFTLDDQTLTEEEMVLIIDVIRTLRQSVSRVKSSKFSKTKKKEFPDTLP
ncbi:helix-turn-helix transcriptional regulator [Bacillus wiedmannii]|uniref:Helix-turn-helix transcriptional regulator n=1 Tax=Bacillus wiedmannii TaxID=1890302 RepID=A0A4U2N3L5_9BACI|nr:helix-turn-helix transcriptional regulator [Bacillus wiedmannii]TKH18973.1 helix-turn-helix transcriptional regulator [Bacillus wiedmannii]